MQRGQSVTICHETGNGKYVQNSPDATASWTTRGTAATPATSSRRSTTSRDRARAASIPARTGPTRVRRSGRTGASHPTRRNRRTRPTAAAPASVPRARTGAAAISSPRPRASTPRARTSRRTPRARSRSRTTGAGRSSRAALSRAARRERFSSRCGAARARSRVTRGTGSRRAAASAATETTSSTARRDRRCRSWRSTCGRSSSAPTGRQATSASPSAASRESSTAGDVKRVTLPAGTYDVTEPPVAGFTTAFDKCAGIVLAAPQSSVPLCTITNTANEGEPTLLLRVIKVVVGSSVRRATSASRSAGGRSRSRRTALNDVELPAGTYDVTEEPVEGYSTTYSGCTGILLAAQQQTVPTCTITNTAKQPALYPLGNFVTCVDNAADGTFSATFGYYNPNVVPVTLAAGPGERRRPGRAVPRTAGRLPGGSCPDGVHHRRHPRRLDRSVDARERASVLEHHDRESRLRQEVHPGPARSTARRRALRHVRHERDGHVQRHLRLRQRLHEPRSSSRSARRTSSIPHQSIATNPRSSFPGPWRTRSR